MSSKRPHMRIVRADIKYIGGVKNDIKNIVAEYLRNTVNYKNLLRQRKIYGDGSAQAFNEDSLNLTQEALLDVHTGKKQFVEFMEQKQREPQIVAEVVGNIQNFVESEQFVNAVSFVKEEYNIENDHAATKKIRQLLYASL